MRVAESQAPVRLRAIGKALISSPECVHRQIARSSLASVVVRLKLFYGLANGQRRSTAPSAVTFPLELLSPLLSRLITKAGSEP